jgi:hypothetical protein
MCDLIRTVPNEGGMGGNRDRRAWMYYIGFLKFLGISNTSRLLMELQLELARSFGMLYLVIDIFYCHGWKKLD